MQNKRYNKNKGYTIIETMIAVSLFVIIVMTGMGALLNANLLHKKSQSMRSIMDSLSFVIEDMSRNLRTGYSYHCISGGDTLPSDVSAAKSGANCWGVAFDVAGGSSANPNDQWVYYIGTDGSSGNIRIFKAIQGPYVQSSFVQLTPDEVVIDPVSGFSIAGSESPASGDYQQPIITIKLVGTITIKNVVTPFSLQTSVTQRLIDV